ncbi:hypothetical protein H2200_004299 [Cladophialophora chaetospira]|uniref:Cytochrome P450 n=1 Tax=Cladophialophora chaetospira TaxID=386627 RepID=A0AA39CKC7_9EURO|nr:hypothetical protein H2200_004299 [Cladophialophora chaetospira]
MYWTLLLVPLALLIYIFFRPANKDTLPDGPRDPIPQKDLRQKLHIHLAECAKTYGDFFSYNMGRSRVVVLCSVQAIEELLVKRGQVWSSRPTSSSQADIITEGARIVNMPYGDDFRKHRKLIHSLLGMQNAKTFLPYQEYESRQTLLNLLNAPELFFQEMSRYSASITFSLLVGARFNRADAFLPNQIGQMMEKFFNNIRPGAWLVDSYPFLDYLPGPLAPWRTAARAIFTEIQEFWSIFLNAIDKRIKEGTAPDCFLSRFLQNPEVVNFNQVERVTITAELLTAGTETTSTTLQWFFKAILTNPEWVIEAQEEIDAVVGRSRLPDFSDRVNLPYLNAVISELHRWASAAALAFFHATSEEDTYRTWKIPRRTTVIPNTYAIHHSEEYFPNPSAFLPGRWLPANDSRHIHDGARTPNHLAFSAGRRECPGRHVADASLFIAISRILWAFDISTGGHPPPADEYGRCSLGLSDLDLAVQMSANSHAVMCIGGSLPVLGPAQFKCRIMPRSSDPETAQKIREFAAKIDQGLIVEDGTVYDEAVKKVLAKRHRKS